MTPWVQQAPVFLSSPTPAISLYHYAEPQRQNSGRLAAEFYGFPRAVLLTSAGSADFSQISWSAGEAAGGQRGGATSAPLPNPQQVLPVWSRGRPRGFKMRAEARKALLGLDSCTVRYSSRAFCWPKQITWLTQI